MKLVQCFKCDQHVTENASRVVPTVDKEAYGAPPLDRVWCGQCIAEAAEATREALAALSEAESWDSKSPQETDDATL